MKNKQKGSAKVWFTLVVIVLVVVASIYLFNSKGGCSITTTDSSGKTTTAYGPCPENAPGLTTAPSDDYDKIGQAMKDVESTYKVNPPAGFLVPTSIPSGYHPQTDPTLFTTDSAQYFYSTGRGVPADKNLLFNEYASSTALYKSLGEYSTSQANDPTIKVVKSFTYNGENGEVVKYTSNPNPSYELVYWRANGNFVQIQATNDPAITPDILISALEAMTMK
jgi:hypothetical protein